MIDPFAENRARVVAEAEAWLRTPYHASARVKGVGVDCAQLPMAVYFAAGEAPRIAASYAPDWHLHRNEELYVEWVLRYAREIEEAEVGPGDMVLWKFGRTFSHGAIVKDWPTCIHAAIGVGVTLVDAAGDEELRTRPKRFFSVWGA